MVFNATFNNIFSYIVVISFIGGGNPSGLSQGTDKRYCIMLYRVHIDMIWIRTHNFSGDWQ